MIAKSVDVQSLLKEFAVVTIVKDYQQRLIKEPPPPVIYHYTDDAGLRGILESGTFWITDIFSLNDPSEIRHGVGHACELLMKAAAGATAGTRLRSFADTVIAALNGRIEQSGHFFICCFSSDDDSLGQWRAYADDGRGYAIGFDTHVLEQEFVRDEGTATFPLSYEEGDLRAIQSQVVDHALKIIATADTALDADHMRYLSTMLSMHVIHASMFFKHKAYKDEREYRFVRIYPVNKPIPVNIRSRPYTLVPYLPFDWKGGAAAAFKEVVVGPAAEFRLGAKFARDCLARYHPIGGTVQIRASTVPYRSLRVR